MILATYKFHPESDSKKHPVIEKKLHMDDKKNPMLDVYGRGQAPRESYTIIFQNWMISKWR